MLKLSPATRTDACGVSDANSPALIESGIRDRKVHKEGKNMSTWSALRLIIFWASSMAEEMKPLKLAQPLGGFRWVD